MRGFIIFLLASFILAGCVSNKSTNSAEGVPPSMEFEIELTKSPITGDVPSENVGKLLTSEISNNLKTKFDIVYPNTWRPVDDRFATLSVSKIAYDPTNTNVFYFCTGEGWFNADAARGNGVWKSSDAGESWQQLSSTTTEDFYYCQDILVHPTSGDVYVTTRDNGLMRSKNGGTTWEQVLGASNGARNNSGADLEITADGDIVVSIGVFSTDGIYISETGDPDSWELIMKGLPSSGYERIEVATAKSNKDVMYCIMQNGNTNKILGIWKTEDKGQNWVQKENPGGNLDMAKVQAWFDLIIEVDPNNENVVVTGGLNQWRSRDGGDTWMQLAEGDLRKKSNLQYMHVDQHEVVFLNSDTVFFLNDGGLYRSDNFTADSPVINTIGVNYNTTQFYSCDVYPFEDNDWVLGGTQDNGSNKSTDKDISHFDRISWADGAYCAIDHQDPSYIYTTTQYRRVYRTHNGKVDTITNYRIVNNNTRFINTLAMDATDPNVLYQATNVGVWAMKNARTGDTASWERICRPLGVVTAIATSTSAPNTVYFGRIQKPFRIDNSNTSGISYTPVSLDNNGDLPAEGYINCIVTDDLDKNHLIAIYSNYDIVSVWETYNAYDNDPDWVGCEGNLPNIPVRWGCLKNGSSTEMFLATEFGVYSTSKLDGENTIWEQNNVGLPNLKVNMLKTRKSDGLFVAATHGRGMFTGYFNEETGKIEWNERGPNNVPGRSRSLMVDPNVSSNKKLWAGSVSGGLWVINNIDSSTYFEEVPESTVLNAYPNPVNEELSLTFNEGNPAEIKIEVYDYLGKEVMSRSYESAPFGKLSVSGLANGIYYLKMTQGEESVVLKIIKRGKI